MPAAGIKVLMTFNDSGGGIGEAHVLLNQTDPTTNLANAAIQQLVKLRSALNGALVAPFRVRASVLGSPRASTVLSPDFLQGLTPAAANYGSAVPGQQTNNNPDQPKACLLLRAQAGLSVRKAIYLAGVPDACITENPANNIPVQVPTWYRMFQAYVALLTNGSWGFVARSPAVGVLGPQQILDTVVNLANSEVGIIVSSAVTTYAAGQKIQIHGTKRSNTAYLSLNNIWQVHSVAAGSPVAGQNTYYLRNSQAVNLAVITLLGTVQGIDYTSTAYTSIVLDGEGTRKRGNSTLFGRGRRSIRKYILA